MSFARADTGRSEGPKKNARQQVRKGAAELNTMKNNFANNEKVKAATAAGKKNLNKAKNKLLSLVGLGNDTEQQPLQGGKRRRKSRRKKRRTKRRRKSRRKRRR